MTDIDRYLTDEAVERTMRALYAYEELERPFESLTRHDLGWLEGQARTTLSAVAPLIAAQALREAAETYTVTIPDALGYKVQAVFIEDLMAHADRIEQGGQS